MIMGESKRLTATQQKLVLKWSGIPKKFSLSYPRRFRRELVQDGMLSLCELAVSYIPGSAASFCTYVWDIVAGRMRDHFHFLLGRIRWKWRRLGDNPRFDSLQKKVLIPASQIGPNKAYNFMEWILEETGRFYDPWQEVNRSIDNDHMRGKINDAMKKIHKGLRHVIEMRFGLNGCDQLTLEATGKAIGVTRERIRQKEARAMRLLADRMEDPREEKPSVGVFYYGTTSDDWSKIEKSGLPAESWVTPDLPTAVRISLAKQRLYRSPVVLVITGTPFNKWRVLCGNSEVRIHHVEKIEKMKHEDLVTKKQEIRNGASSV